MSRGIPGEVHIHIDRLVLDPEFAGVDRQALERAVVMALEGQGGRTSAGSLAGRGRGTDPSKPDTGASDLGRHVAAELLRGELGQALDGWREE